MTRGPLYYLADSHPLGQLARSEQLPCCSLVAAVVLECTGVHPAPATLRAYSAAAPHWWQRANVYNPQHPWSAIAAAQQRLGGPQVYVEQVGPDLDAQSLQLGWHTVQRWKRLEQGQPGPADDVVGPSSSGHTYLVHQDADGVLTVVQSSVSQGLRIETGGRWEGTAGLDGYAVMVHYWPGL
jgi:hypothetical protein